MSLTAEQIFNLRKAIGEKFGMADADNFWFQHLLPELDKAEKWDMFTLEECRDKPMTYDELARENLFYEHRIENQNRRQTDLKNEIIQLKQIIATLEGKS
jgi:hypothetical protein